MAGDVMSRHVLGDVYSNQPIETELSVPLPEDTSVVAYDPVEALAWYTMAATHDFDAYNQAPTLEQLNARIRARTRVPTLRAEMTDEAVEKAEARVVQLLSLGSASDLYRLGVMHQRGEGLPKDNARAFMFYKLAQDRSIGSSAAASEAIAYLASVMNQGEIQEATLAAQEWQPPLPDAYTAKSPRQVAMEQDLLRLRALQAEPAFARLEEQFNGNEHLIQNALAALGLYLAKVDGKVGPGTREAIRKFQYTLVEADESLTPEEKRDVQTGVLTVAQKLELIRQAAERQHPQSQYVYGVMHADGIGVQVDGVAASDWLKRSASFGYPLAHFALGEYYSGGIQGEQPLAPSLAQASYHYGQAAALGYEPAAKKLVNLRYEFEPAR
jgi:TPR repeat protein